MDINETLTAIRTADSDELNRIEDAIKARRRALTASIKVGDYLELHDVSPKFLAGTIVEVTGFRKTRILVKPVAGANLARAIERFGAHGTAAQSAILRPVSALNQRYLDAYLATVGSAPTTAATGTAAPPAAPVTPPFGRPYVDAVVSPQIGERYELQNVKPKYLAGTVVEVVGYGTSRVKVKLIAGAELARAIERFGETANVTLNMLAAITPETQAFLDAIAKVQETAQHIIDSADEDEQALAAAGATAG
jgi:hypothetical protein